MFRKTFFSMMALIILISSASATSSLTIGTLGYSSSVLKDESFTVTASLEAASVSSTITVTITLTDSTNAVSITSAEKTVSFSNAGTQNIQWSVKANNPGTYTNPFTITATANDGGQASPKTSPTSLTIQDRPVLTVNVTQNATTVSPDGYVQLAYTINNIASPEAASATDVNASLVYIPAGWTVITPNSYTISSIQSGGSQSSGYFTVKAPSSSGSYNINLGVVSAQGESITIGWTLEVIVSNEVPLSITSSSPSNDATTLNGTGQTFGINLNRTSNVTWYINGSSVQSDLSVTTANYFNNSAGPGAYNITAIATDGNYTVSRTWNWTVLRPISFTVSPDNSSISSRYVNVTVTLERAGNATLAWDGGANESMGDPGTSFYKNKTDLLSGNYSFRVFVNDSYGSTNSTGTRTVIVSLTNTTPLTIDSGGNVSGQVNITSPGGNVTVTISNGTNATVNGTTITNITIDSPRIIPYALTGDDVFIGENLTLGPEGAVFNPAIMINFSYNDSQLTAAGNIPAARLKIKFYNNTTSGWDELTTTINQTSRIVTATTTHFSTFTLTGTQTPASNPPSSGSSGSSGGGGGGGGGSSGEKYSNILTVEKYDLQISKDALTSYRFTNTKNPIMFVNITGNTSLGIITTSVEVLKDTSSLVKTPPDGLVYENANIWVGTAGFATPKNIKEALIKFRINNDRMSTNGVLATDIVLVKWDGTRWIDLETKVLSKDNINTYFEGKTNSFSPFAIVAKTAAGPKPMVATSNPVETPKITATAMPAATKKAAGFGIVIALAGLMAVVLRKRGW